MGRAERFEDLVVWQEARRLRKQIAAVARLRSFADPDMRRQLTRAALSVMNNVAEGFERGTNKEFAQFLHTAKGSAGEVRSILYAAADDGFITNEQFTSLSAEATTLARRLSAFIKYLQRPPAKTLSPDNLQT